MKCPRCDAEVPAGAKTCGNCGAQFAAGQYCPHCGKVIPKGSQKCPKCGKAIAQAAGTSPPGSGGKKPLTKRWWFWVVCILLVLGIISNLGNAMNRQNGSGRPSPSPAAAASASPSPTPTVEPTAIPSPTPSPTPEPTPIPTPSPVPETASEMASVADPQGSENTANHSGNTNNFNAYDNPDQQQTSASYVLNTSTMKFHYPNCNDVKKIAPENYATFNGTREEAQSNGYSPCGHCKP